MPRTMNKKLTLGTLHKAVNTKQQTAVFLAFNKHIADELRVQFSQPPNTTHKASVYQQGVYDFITNGVGNAVVEAVPGSGKTYTLIQSLHLLPCKAEDVQICTVHSLGFAALRNAFGKINLNEQKVSNILERYLPIDRSKGFVPREQFKAILATRKVVAKLVSLCKFNLNTGDNLSELRDMCEYYSLDVNGALEENFHLVKTVLNECLEMTNVIDFDDMIWMPVAANIPVQEYDWVFIDESQDLNKCQQELVAKTLTENGRLVAVGDPNQSLYGFSGADPKSMERLAERFNATQLPLSISYRCPKTHVERAKLIVPQIESAPDAIDGLIADIEEQELYKVVQNGDMILCRTNKPLIQTAFALIRQGVKAVVRGRDIGQGIVAFIDRLKPTSLPDLGQKLTEYARKEGEKLLRQEKMVQYDLLVDKVETVECFVVESTSLDDLKQRIERLFTDTITGVVLSSVHRAKGCESRRIFILRPDLLPFPKAVKTHEREAENCVKFVALTRSKEEMYFVLSEVKQP